MKRPTLTLATALLGLAFAVPARADTDDQARTQRWHDLQQAVFGARPVRDGTAILSLAAPTRAEDAALVPIAVTATGKRKIAGLYVLIDDNPAPLAAHFTFGPNADPHELRMRVRVDQYTDMHAVAETEDGALYAVAAFVKAAGGCSAPAGGTEAEALQGVGQMKLHVLGGGAPGQSTPVELLIRHPNFNGMQMNQVTRLYTKARFLNAVEVTYNGGRVFHLDSDISMSTNPAITFSLLPQAQGTLKVVASDTDHHSFTQSFSVPAQGS